MRCASGAPHLGHRNHEAESLLVILRLCGALFLSAEEHLPNTLRQMLIYQALGFSVPHFGHVSLILAPDKSKLSKRCGVRACLALAGCRDHITSGWGPVFINVWRPGNRNLYLRDQRSMQLFSQGIRLDPTSLAYMPSRLLELSCLGGCPAGTAPRAWASSGPRATWRPPW